MSWAQALLQPSWTCLPPSPASVATAALLQVRCGLKANINCLLLSGLVGSLCQQLLAASSCSSRSSKSSSSSSRGRNNATSLPTPVQHMPLDPLLRRTGGLLITIEGYGFSTEASDVEVVFSNGSLTYPGVVVSSNPSNITVGAGPSAHLAHLLHQPHARLQGGTAFVCLPKLSTHSSLLLPCKHHPKHTRTCHSSAGTHPTRPRGRDQPYHTGCFHHHHTGRGAHPPDQRAQAPAADQLCVQRRIQCGPGTTGGGHLARTWRHSR